MTQLIASDNQDQFIMKLNQLTGFNTGLFIPHLKFNGETGMWQRETELKDTENKPVYEDIAESITFHIVTTRKMVQSTFSSELGWYSREFMDDYVEIMDKTGQVILKGLYTKLKLNEPDLMFIQVLYVFYEGKPYRVKLNGSKLMNYFPYINSFKGSSPVMFDTTASRGEQKKKGSVLYYELNFTKGAPVDQKTIVERVNAVLSYITAYNQMKKKSEEQEEPPMIEEEIQVDTADLPF